MSVSVYDEKLYNFIDTTMISRKTRRHIINSIKEIINNRAKLQKRYPQQYSIKVYEDELDRNTWTTFANAIAYKLMRYLVIHIDSMTKYKFKEHRQYNMLSSIHILSSSAIGYEKHRLYGSDFRLDIFMLLEITHEAITTWDKIYDELYMVQVTIKGKGYRSRDNDNRLYAQLEEYSIEDIKIKTYNI